MGIFVCIDDTDNIDSIGTGEVADRIKASLEQELGLISSMTTRHQLLIHEDIPYTSHNSSMCFEIPKGAVDHVPGVIEVSKRVLIASMAEGSDPGLCVVSHPDEVAARVLQYFGKAAKTRVVSKMEAYDIAAELGIHLSEHGGTGDGIIGALAGVGLRLSGNDGEVKGGLKDIKKGLWQVEDLKRRLDVDRILDITKDCQVHEGSVLFNKRSKSIYRDGRYTLLVKALDEGYEAIGKRAIRQMETEINLTIQEAEALETCHKFEADVVEEQLDSAKICHNCRHRRWEAEGYLCLKGL